MITKIWLKGKTNSKDTLSFPNCYPVITVKIGEHKSINIINDILDKREATYIYNLIARIEFRP